MLILNIIMLCFVPVALPYILYSDGLHFPGVCLLVMCVSTECWKTPFYLCHTCQEIIPAHLVMTHLTSILHLRRTLVSVYACCFLYHPLWLWLLVNYFSNIYVVLMKHYECFIKSVYTL